MSSEPRAPLPQRVFQRLSDRDYQSGEALAADLAVTRAAVWKAVEQLRELGVSLDAQTHKGYRLAAGVSPLSAEGIEALLPAELRALIESLDVEWTLESTNTRLLDSLPPAVSNRAFGTVEQVGRMLFGPFVLPFEPTSILLLVAIVGAVVVAKAKI